MATRFHKRLRNALKRTDNKPVLIYVCAGVTGGFLSLIWTMPVLGISGAILAGGACVILEYRRSWRGTSPDDGAPVRDDLASLPLPSEEKDRLRLDIFATDYGRSAGWHVERDGRRVALLKDPRFEDMFWESYHVTPLTDDAAERQALTTAEFWLGNDLVYRSARFGLAVDSAIPSLSEPYREGRLHVRGLYLMIPEPTFKEKRLLKKREAGKKRSGQ